MHDAGKVASFISVDYLQGICRIDGRQAEAISQILREWEMVLNPQKRSVVHRIISYVVN